MAVRWTTDEDALSLLDQSGHPFNAARYRDAWVGGQRGWTDVSYGGRAADGARAAVALLRRCGTARSLPLGYGGIVATRDLSGEERSAFLCAARRRSRSFDLVVVTVQLGANEVNAECRQVGSTSVLFFNGDASPDAKVTKKAREALVRGRRAGGVPLGGHEDPACFLALYGPASRGWGTAYPSGVIEQLAGSGLLRTYNVELEGSVEASAVALVGDDHWMYWLAAQSDRGRGAELGYLALEALIEDAHRSGAHSVNLGASAGLPGVAQFKRRFGGVDVPIYESRSTVPPASIVRGAADLAHRTLNIGRRARRWARI